MAVSEERPGAQQWVPERPSTESLHEAVQACRGCELFRDATQAVMGEGPPGATPGPAPLMQVGEQPGDQEDQQGRPFVGPAGRLLAEALAAAGIDRGAVYRTNVVKHFRHEGTRGKQRLHKNPARAHVVACGPWLVAELDVVRPPGVVLLGATAGKALLGPTFRVGEERGRVQPWPATLPGGTPAHRPDWVLATAHPSSVLRSQTRDEDLDALVADLRVVAAQLSAT